MRETNTEIAPKFVACRIDVSEFCSADLLDRCGGKVYLSGFFDDNLDTYCCSAEKMIFVEGLEFVPERYPEDERLSEQLNMELLENHADDGYYSRSTIERMRKTSPEDFEDLGLTFDEDEDPSEVVREELQGNPRF